MEPVYVVSGFHRSGTSMMTLCLHKGGLRVSYDPLTDGLAIDEHGEYDPNPNGFFQFADDEINAALPEFYAGRLIKMNWRLLKNLPGTNYRMILMVRPPEEIRQSVERCLPWESEELAALDLYDLLISSLQQRYNAQVVHYRDMLASPEEVLAALDWPIDPKAASLYVDHALYRHRGV